MFSLYNNKNVLFFSAQILDSKSLLNYKTLNTECTQMPWITLKILAQVFTIQAPGEILFYKEFPYFETNEYRFREYMKDLFGDVMVSQPWYLDYNKFLGIELFLNRQKRRILSCLQIFLQWLSNVKSCMKSVRQLRMPMDFWIRHSELGTSGIF